MGRYAASHDDDWAEGLDPEGPSAEDIERFDDDRKACPRCRFEMYDDATVCPRCGYVFDSSDSGRGQPWPLAIVAVVGFVLAMIGVLVLIF